MENKLILLKKKNANGQELRASFNPEMGMNLMSFRSGNIEAIDQSTIELFEERYAGLGALIGPHFHHQKEELIPKVVHEERFPHIARVKAKAIKDPFSHGIARYAPWKINNLKEDQFSASISGQDMWRGIDLKSLEGCDFEMHYNGKLTEDGLELQLDVEALRPSVVGFHFYYALPMNQGRVQSFVQEEYYDLDEWKGIPKEWIDPTKEHHLDFDLSQNADFGFHSFPDPLSSKVQLDAITHRIEVDYKGKSEESSWQLYHPKDASFVCIEPIGAKNPRLVRFNSSFIEAKIKILDPF